MTQSHKEAARHILESMRNMQTTETYNEVNESSFPHLNLQQYEQVRTTLSEHGFKYLADLELLEASQSPRFLCKPTMIRTYVSADGSTVAAHYQLKPRLDRLFQLLINGILNLRLIDAPMFVFKQLPTRDLFDFETEFEDGTFQITSNAADAGLLSQPVAIDGAFYPYEMPLLSLLKHHQERLQRRQSSGAKSVIIKSLVDWREMESRLKTLKDAHRRSIQWVGQRELQAMSPNEELSDAVFAEIQRLLKEERKAVNS